MTIETSQGKPEGQPEAGSPQGQPGAEAVQAKPAESQATPEEIARWKALDAKFKEQNVDPDQLLPEFTRRSQQLKEVSDEASQWRSFFQQQRQASQPQPQDRAEQLVREIAEIGYTDPARAETLRRELFREEARQVAREEHQRLSQSEKAQRAQESVIVRAQQLGIAASEVNALAAKVAQDPNAVAFALAYAKDPNKAEEMILADRKRRESEANDKSRVRSILDAGGRNPGLGAKVEEDADAPLDIPESLYFGKPESYWKRTLGERFGRIRLTRHDGTPVRQT